jgi:hypothetical protein
MLFKTGTSRKYNNLNGLGGAVTILGKIIRIKSESVWAGSSIWLSPVFIFRSDPLGSSYGTFEV